MGGNESEQVQRQSTPEEVQEAIQVKRKLIEDQHRCPTILVSKCSNLVTLITKNLSGWGPFYCIGF